MRTSLKCYLSLFISFLLGACTCVALTQPHDPLWNRVGCHHCRMTLSSERYAVQLVGPGARIRYYDDLGCALEDMRQSAEVKGWKLFVRPHPGKEWIPAENARYEDSHATPMNYGFAAVRGEGKYSFQEVASRLNGGM